MPKEITNMFWKKNKGIILTIVYPIIFLVVVLWLARYAIFRINQQRNHNQELITLEENRSQRLSSLPRLKGDFEFSQEAEKEMGKMIEPGEAIVLIEELEKIAERTGNTISIETQEEKDKNTLRRPKSEKDDKSARDIASSLPLDKFIRLRISIGGSYSSLANFLYKLENVAYYSDIISINIAPSEQTSSSVNSAPVNPFAGIISPQKDRPLPEKKKILQGILEVVFYTK